MANLEKIVYCASEEAFEGIAEKNENALYLTPDNGGGGGSSGGAVVPFSNVQMISGMDVSTEIGGPCFFYPIPPGITKLKYNKADQYASLGSSSENYIGTVNLTTTEYNYTEFGDAYKIYVDSFGNNWLFGLHYGDFYEGAPIQESAWLE